MLLLVILLAIRAGLAGSIPAAPENITVTFINPTSVRVSWQQSVDAQNPVEKYDVTYKPTDARVVAVVSGKSEAVVLRGLISDTQYQVTVTAIWSGRKYRSRPIQFRTLAESPRTSPQQDFPMDENVVNVLPPLTDPRFKDVNHSTNATTRSLPTIRGVEIGIVVLVLMVWAGAIGLFFNRWGKIRMLLPYQPDYKQDQLKVPGAATCPPGQCNGHQHQWEEEEELEDDDAETADIFELNWDVYEIQHIHPQHWTAATEESSTIIAERCQRARINSAIFVSSEGRGFDSIEFIRRYGSQSVLCRKTKSAENIPAGNPNRRFSANPSINHKHWQSDEPSTVEKVEVVECHNEPPSLNHNLMKAPKLLAALPTLSISGPSPAPSRTQSPEEQSPEEEEEQKFL